MNIEVQIHRTPGPAYQVYFNLSGTSDEYVKYKPFLKKRVNLSDSGTVAGCDMPIRMIDTHNWHAQDYSTVDQLTKYINRVIGDINVHIMDTKCGLPLLEQVKSVAVCETAVYASQP